MSAVCSRCNICPGFFRQSDSWRVQDATSVCQQFHRPRRHWERKLPSGDRHVLV